jgi:hypothetical protein
VAAVSAVETLRNRFLDRLKALRMACNLQVPMFPDRFVIPIFNYLILFLQEGAPGSTNEIADKLRMAATKGWIDPVVFCSNNKLSNQTASLLNTLINRLTLYEQNTLKIDQLKVSF